MRSMNSTADIMINKRNMFAANAHCPKNNGQNKCGFIAIIPQKRTGTIGTEPRKKAKTK